MKTTKVIEVAACDVCGTNNNVYEHCEGPCNRDVCLKCSKTWHQYHAWVFSQGPGDAVYCPQCHRALSGKNEKLEVYKQIKALRVEHDDFHKEFMRRKEIQEKRLQELLRQ